MSNTTTPVYLGHSHDWRTNRWRLTCPSCSHQWEPQTTMFAVHHISCPRCGKGVVARYNDLTVHLEEEPK